MVEIRISGDRGSGKTAIALEIARYLKKETACQVELVGRDEHRTMWLNAAAQDDPSPGYLTGSIPVIIHDDVPRPQRRSIHRKYTIAAYSQGEAFEELQIRVQESIDEYEIEELVEDLGIDPNNWQFKCYEQPGTFIEWLMGHPSVWVFYVTFKRLEG